MYCLDSCNSIFLLDMFFSNLMINSFAVVIFCNLSNRFSFDWSILNGYLIGLVMKLSLLWSNLLVNPMLDNSFVQLVSLCISQRALFIFSVFCRTLGHHKDTKETRPDSWKKLVSKKKRESPYFIVSNGVSAPPRFSSPP